MLARPPLPLSAVRDAFLSDRKPVLTAERALPWGSHDLPLRSPRVEKLAPTAERLFGRPAQRWPAVRYGETAK